MVLNLLISVFISAATGQNLPYPDPRASPNVALSYSFQGPCVKIQCNGNFNCGVGQCKASPVPYAPFPHNTPVGFSPWNATNYFPRQKRSFPQPYGWNVDLIAAAIGHNPYLIREAIGDSVCGSVCWSYKPSHVNGSNIQDSYLDIVSYQLMKAPELDCVKKILGWDATVPHFGEVFQNAGCTGCWPPYPGGRKSFSVETTNQASWLGAWTMCLRKNGRLASIETKEEESQVLQAIAWTGHRMGKFWIAGTDYGSQNNFIWATTGKPIEPYIPTWHARQPDSFGMAEDCIELWEIDNSFGYKWNDRNCMDQNFYICEYYK